MATGYVVTSPLVQALVGPDLYVHVYEGGVLPSNVDKDQLAQLIETKMVEQREVTAGSTEPDGDAWHGADAATVDQVLEYVGDDADRAAEVLEQEQAGKNRSTLVEKLQRIADPAQD